MLDALPAKDKTAKATAVDYPKAVAFYFKVAFADGSGDFAASFQDVSGLSVELETETYVEGGGNVFGYRLPKGVKYQNLVLSRSIGPADSRLIRWCTRTLEGGLANAIETKLLKVALLDPEGTILHAWTFQGAYPVKWQADSFNSQKNDVAIEKIEFAFNTVTREMI
jgi:phage tail-like protein